MAKFNIYGKSGILRAELYAAGNSTHQTSVQGESTLALSMISQTCVRLEPGDFTDFLGSRFWLLEAYTPKQVSTVEWSYDVKFTGVEGIVKQALMLNSEGVPLEAYHAPAGEQLAMVVMNLNRWMNTQAWETGECVETENLDIDYSGGTYCDEALSKIAEAAGVEWWMEGTVINISRAEHGEAIELGYGDGLLTIERDNADNVPFFTRLFPVGSSRNIEYGSYGHSRLQMPGGVKYVERNADKYGVVERYEEEAFAGIFPRRTGYVSSVRTEQAKNDDGTAFTIYYFRDSGLNFNPNDYEIGGLVKHVIFQSGDVAGRDFEVNYNATTQEFEIITQWPYDDDTQVPGGLLIPGEGDAYILYNIKMPQEYYPAAEEELAAAVAGYLNEHAGQTDRSVYKCRTNYVQLDGRSVTLTVGQRVRLASDRFFPGVGYRDSRITRISRNANRPNEADIEISDVISKTARTSMQESIAAVRHEFKTSGDRMEQAYLSRVEEDTARKQITFREGIKANTVESESPFNSGQLGTGWKAWMKNGQSYFEADNLFVRREAVFSKLTIAEIKAVGGQILVSLAGIYCTKASSGNGFYRCFFDDGSENPANMFSAGDQAICRRFTGNAVKYYWRLVTGTGKGYIDLSKTDADGTGIPEAGDEIIQMGNRNDSARQSAILISAYGADSPSIRQYAGISSYDLTGREVTSMSPAGNVFSGSMTVGDNRSYLRFDPVTGQMILKGTLVQSQSGETQPLGIFRGEYSSSDTYYEGDEVTCQGSTYRFISSTPQTGKLPSDTTYWTVVAAKGEAGANGQASDWKSFAYKKSASKPASPSDTTEIPAGWKDYPDSEATGDDKWWMAVAMVHWTGTEWIAGSFVNGVFTPGQWSEAIPVTGEQGTDGQYVDFKFCATANMTAPTWNSTLANMLNPTGWSDQSPQLPASGAIWMIEAWKQAGGTQLVAAWSTPVRISGEKGAPGQDGQDGAYSEYRYAKNSSTASAPALSAASAEPSGWTVTVPAVGTGEYLWMTVAKKSSAGALLQNWSAAVRISGEKGAAGATGAAGTNGTNGTNGQPGSYTSFVFKLSDTQPAAPSGTNPLPSGWSDAPAASNSNLSNIGHASTWPLQSDGTRKSPAIAHSGFTSNRISFTTAEANQVIKIDLQVSSESGYDFALVGLLDNPNLSRTANYTDRISGTAQKSIAVNIPSAGTHYIDVGYGKDGSAVGGSDCAWYRITAGALWWMSKATVTYQNGQWLAGAWSVPVKVTGQDGSKGQDGAPGTQGPAGPTGAPGTKGDTGAKGDTGPSPVYRGNWLSSELYYGTAKRVDIVQYNNNFYVAKTTYGSGISGRTPTNTSYWETFGAQFTSVATHLLLADSAFIADWIIANGKITSKTSTADGTPRARFDGQNGGITFASDVSRLTETSVTQTVKQTIRIDSQLAEVEAKSGDDVSFINSQGIYANRAGLTGQAIIPVITDRSVRGAIVGVGKGAMNRSSYGDSGCIAGVVGVAVNSSANPTAAFGGLFTNLMALGLNLSVKRMYNTDDSYVPTENDCFFSCYNPGYITIYFNAPKSIGKVYYIRNNNGNTVNLNTYANGGKQIMMPNGSLVNSSNSTSRGELITLIWDGQYWLYSTTAS